MGEWLEGVISVSGTPTRLRLTAPHVCPANPGTPSSAQAHSGPCSQTPRACPAAGCPSAPQRESEGFAAAGRAKAGLGEGGQQSGGVGHLKSRPGSLGLPRIDPSPPGRLGTAEAGRPGPGSPGRAGGGARRGARRSNSSTGGSDPPACHSPSASPALAAGRTQADARARTPVPASGSPAHAPAGEGGGETRRGGVLKGPLSLSSGIQAGAHPPSSLGSRWAEPGGGGEPPPQAAPPSRLAESRPPPSRGSLRPGGGLRSLLHVVGRGVRTGPRSPGRSRVGGGGGGGDSAALRPPPRNFAAAGAAVATGTESFCSPMSGLPGPEGGRRSQVGPGPGHTARRTPAKQSIGALRSRQSQGSSNSWGPRVRWPPNSDLGC